MERPQPLPNARPLPHVPQPNEPQRPHVQPPTVLVYERAAFLPQADTRVTTASTRRP
jgi:hypothetical protein